MEIQTKTDAEIYIFLCLLFLANRRSRAINKKLITINHKVKIVQFALALLMEYPCSDCRVSG